MARKQRLWKSVKLFVKYFETQSGKKREKPYDWDAECKELDLGNDTSKRIVVAKVGSDCGADLVVGFSPQNIVVSRDTVSSWNGVVLTEDSVRVKIGEMWVDVFADGRVIKEDGPHRSGIMRDGAMFRNEPGSEIFVDAAGQILARES